MRAFWNTLQYKELTLVICNLMTTAEQRFFDSVPRRLDGIERNLEKISECLEKITDIVTIIYGSKE